MTGRSRFSPEQLEKIRATLKQSLGGDSDQVLSTLEGRFGPGAADPEDKGMVNLGDDEDEDKGSRSSASSRDPGGRTNIVAIIEEGKPEKMLKALPQVRGDPTATKALVVGILQNGKGFHMVEALGCVKDDAELVNHLVNGIIAKKGINPAIDALKFAGHSDEAMAMLAQYVAENGTVNHIVRAIATAPVNSASEMIWAMELIGKATVEQMLEALTIFNKESDGVVILATGVISSKDATLEQVVRALTHCKDNPKAASLIAVELAKKADVNALGTILDKYISDKTEAGEIVVAKLVQAGRVKQMVAACKSLSQESPVARMLASGIAKRGTVEELERAYRLLTSNPTARQIVALEIVRKKGKLMALRVLGSEVWDLLKNEQEILAFAKKATARQAWVLKNFLDEENVRAPGASA